MSEHRGQREMRRHDRLLTELPVVVTDRANRVEGGIRFDTADFSAGGAFLRSDLLFEVGEVLDIEFELPSGRGIQVRGRVVRVSRESSDERIPGMGIAFVDFATEDRAALEAHLRGD